MKRTSKVTCPSCGHEVSAVLDSRGVARLRVCVECGDKYMSVERFYRRMPSSRTRLRKSDLIDAVSAPKRNL